MTAGPIERAFKFLNNAALSGSAPGEGVAVGAEDAMGDATVALDDDGVSWADTAEIAKTETIKAQQRTVRVVMRGLSSRLISVGQARRLPGQVERLPLYPYKSRGIALGFDNVFGAGLFSSSWSLTLCLPSRSRTHRGSKSPRRPATA